MFGHNTYFVATFLICLAQSIKAKADSNESLYNDSFESIELMLSNNNRLDFSKAVFLVEDSYFEGQIDSCVFNDAIHFYTSICRGIMRSGNVVYPESDSLKAAAQCAVFVFMTDAIPVMTRDGVQIHTPFQYNFDDFAGQKEWSSMFVSTLLQSNHSV
jgi:hypothetical protein